VLLALLLLRFEMYYLEVSRRVEHSIVRHVSCVEKFVDQELDLLVRESGDLDDPLVLSHLADGHCRHVFD